MQDPLDNTSASASNESVKAAAAALDEGWARDTLAQLAFANLNEQKTARRWKVGLRMAWLLLLALVFWQAFSFNSPTSNPSLPHTAMVSIVGEIGSETQASAENVMSSMRLALEDSGSQALVLLINSPGGSPVQAGLINDEIIRLRALHNKPIYAVVEESCASAAYYIAAAADQIYVDKASIVGSIGVLMDGFGFTGLMDKLGVERRLMVAGRNKAMLDPFSPQDETQKAYIQAMLGEIHTQFITVVKKGRGTRLKETPDTFTGLVWSGQQAVALGLADGLGSLDFVAREIVKAEDIVDYTQRENLGLRLAKRFGASVGEGVFLATKAAGVQLK